MSIRDEFFQTSRSQEDEYFRRRDSEWIKKMQEQAELEAECRQMAEAIGTDHPQILQDLQELGYTRDTVKLLYLVPLLHVAWIEGHVTQREHKRISEVAKLRGIEEHSLASSQLTQWLAKRPRPEFFETTLAVIQDLLRVLPVEQGQVIKEDLLSGCADVAAASGGLLGMGQTISDTEQALLKHIIGELEDTREAAIKQPEET